jgi:glucokinase
MSYYIAIDIGGTQIRAALFPAEQPIPIQVVKINTQGDGEAPADRILNLVAKLSQNLTVSGIGVAAPGPIDPYQGIVIEAPNIPGWSNIRLRQIIEDRFHVPTVLGNDANLAALAEWKYGIGQGHHNLIYITVSTGIGGGVIIDDQLLLGERGLAGELGHVTVLPDGPVCGCGIRGHLEAISSGPSIARWTEEQIKNGKTTILPKNQALYPKQIASAANEGDELAIQAFARAGKYLGIAFANYIHIFNPTIIIVGGGVSHVGSLLFDPILASLHENILSKSYTENFKLSHVALGDDVGLMGALALVKTAIKD